MRFPIIRIDSSKTFKVECLDTMVEPKYIPARLLISKKACNNYLNLNSTLLTKEMWDDVQYVILSGKIYPPINVIEIVNSNIKTFDIHPLLQKMIIC